MYVRNQLQVENQESEENFDEQNKERIFYLSSF